MDASQLSLKLFFPFYRLATAPGDKGRKRRSRAWLLHGTTLQDIWGVPDRQTTHESSVHSWRKHWLPGISLAFASRKSCWHYQFENQQTWWTHKIQIGKSQHCKNLTFETKNRLSLQQLSLRFHWLELLSQVRDLCVSMGIAMTIEDTWGGDIVTATIAHLAHSTPVKYRFSSTDFARSLCFREGNFSRSYLPPPPGSCCSLFGFVAWKLKPPCTRVLALISFSYVGVSIADGTPQRCDGSLEASREPGLGITPKLAVLGEPVLSLWSSLWHPFWSVQAFQPSWKTSSISNEKKTELYSFFCFIWLCRQQEGRTYMHHISMLFWTFTFTDQKLTGILKRNTDLQGRLYMSGKGRQVSSATSKSFWDRAVFCGQTWTRKQRHRQTLGYIWTNAPIWELDFSHKGQVIHCHITAVGDISERMAHKAWGWLLVLAWFAGMFKLTKAFAETEPVFSQKRTFTPYHKAANETVRHANNKNLFNMKPNWCLCVIDL